MSDQGRNSEIDQAFAHPEARSRAIGGGACDRLSLRDHIVAVEIGAFQQERGRTQRLRFNLVVELVPARTATDDDVDRILSYDTLTEAIETELAHQRLNLLETLAERVAARILRAPQALCVILRIEKLDRGAGALGVEILRRKTDRGAAGDAAKNLAENLAENPAQTVAQNPAQTMAGPARVIWLSPAALEAPALPAALGKWIAQTPDLIFCAAAGAPVPQVAQPAAQRRIDLLAADQSAWRLAALCPACTVIDSRTELDWAVKNRRPAIWAPSRIVLGAVGACPPVSGGGAALAAWFARLIGARRLLLVGENGRTDAALAVERLEIADLSAL